MLGRTYLQTARDLVARFEETQAENVERAAELIAEAIACGHTLYAWGGPHSSLPVQDIFWRAGGLALVNPLFTPGLSLEQGPIYLTSTYERLEGPGHEFFEKIGAEEGDAIILVSTSGRNSFPIEMAMSARQAGLKVIGLTSVTYSLAVSSRHSSGKRMFDFCDVVIDNLAVPGDAILQDPRLPQKVGPTSGWMGCLALQSLMAEVAERLADKGVVPPIYYALNLDGNEEYVRYLEGLQRANATRYGGIYSPRRRP